MFNLQLVVTEWCNLDCRYCYMKDNPNRMDNSNIDLIRKNLPKILETFGANKYNVMYFGGEPLSNWEVIKYAAPFFANDENCNYQTIATNGLLLDEEKLDIIHENNVGVSFSFDGIWTDKNRPLKGGLPTLEKYMALKPLIHSNISGGCKCMVAPGNLETMTENYEFFVETYDLPFADFSLVRDDIWTQTDIDTYAIELKRLADRNIKYVKDGILTWCGMFKLPILDMVAGKKYGKRQFSCFSGCKGTAIGPENIAYPCARFLSEKRFPIYDLNTGVFNKESIEQFSLNNTCNNPLGHEKCKSCELYEVCNTGCKHSEMYEQDGKYLVEPIDTICELFKINYKESIRVMEELKDNEMFKAFVKNRIGAQVG